MRRTSLALITLLALAAAPAARADDYPATTAAELTGALVDAKNHAGLDRVLVAAGTYDGSFTYSSADPVEILGAGEDQTTITNTSATGLFVAGGAHHVADIGFDVASGSPVFGLVLGGSSTADHVRVVGHPAATNATGIKLQGDVALRHATVSGMSSRGVWGVGGAFSPTIEDVEVSGAYTGIEVESAGAQAIVRRVRVHGSAYSGVAATFGSSVSLSDSLVEAPAGTFGLRVSDNGNNTDFTTHLEARRVTVVGAPTAVGARVESGSAGDDMRITLRDSIVTGADTAIACYESTGAAAVDGHYSDLQGTRSGACGDITDDHDLAVDPQFADAAAGDYRLAAGSPLLDAGDPAGVLGPGTTDLNGEPRPIDADGDCVRRVDLGAYERRRDVPVAKAAAGAASALTGREVGFSAAGSCDPEPADVLSYSWAFDDGGHAGGAEVVHAFAVAGDHVATLTVSDGVHSATATAAVHVDAAPAADPGPGTAPAGRDPRPAAEVPPRLARVRVDGRRHVLTFSLDRPATVRVTLRRRVHGRWRTVRLPAVNARAGRNRVALGRRPGRWQVRVVAVGADGARSPASSLAARLR